MTNEELKKFLDSATGQYLRDFILEEIYKLRDISNVREYSNAQSQALELKSQKKALTKLEKIFATIMAVGGREIEPKEQYYNLP